MSQKAALGRYRGVATNNLGVDMTNEFNIEQMINAYGKPILRYCHLMLRDYHEAQDVVQTTFVRAFYAKKPPNDKLSAWLYKIAYNCCIDILRKRKRWLKFLDDTAKSGLDDSYCMEDGMSYEIRTALGVLSPQDRAIIISRLVDDLDYQQIS